MRKKVCLSPFFRIIVSTQKYKNITVKAIVPRLNSPQYAVILDVKFGTPPRPAQNAAPCSEAFIFPPKGQKHEESKKNK